MSRGVKRKSIMLSVTEKKNKATNMVVDDKAGEESE